MHTLDRRFKRVGFCLKTIFRLSLSCKLIIILSDFMKKFKMLRTLVYVLRVIGWLVFASGIILAGVAIFSPNVLSTYGIQMTNGSAWITALGILLASVLYTILFLAVAEQLMLMLSLEDNMKQLREFFVPDKK